MAACAGLPLVEDRKDPRKTTTYGVGQLILAAAAKGVKKIIVGLGGSSTNDGGCGAAAAVGVKFYNDKGEAFVPTGGTTHEIARIDMSGRDKSLEGVEIVTMCDIDSPLCGPAGASAVYGPQKGASPEMIPRLDAALRRFADTAARVFPGCDPDATGSGAAGGLGFGFAAFLGAQLRPGAAIVLEETGLTGLLSGSDLCFTGEGRFDFQTSMGKAPAAVARLAREQGVPVIALAGSVQPDAPLGEIDAVFPVPRAPMSLADAMDPETARQNIAAAAEQILRLWLRARQ